MRASRGAVPKWPTKPRPAQGRFDTQVALKATAPLGGHPRAIEARDHEGYPMVAADKHSATKFGNSREAARRRAAAPPTPNIPRSRSRSIAISDPPIAAKPTVEEERRGGFTAVDYRYRGGGLITSFLLCEGAGRATQTFL